MQQFECVIVSVRQQGAVESCRELVTLTAVRRAACCDTVGVMNTRGRYRLEDDVSPHARVGALTHHLPSPLQLRSVRGGRGRFLPLIHLELSHFSPAAAEIISSGNDSMS